MGAIDYGRFQRVLLRCAEIAAEPGMKSSVVRVHQETLKPAADAFLAAHDNMRKAETAFRKEQREALEALEALDAPYREARSVVLAFAPDTVLLNTLKAQKTDTDKLNAIEKLLDTLDDHAGEVWADELAQGMFGDLAASTVKELNESIAANKALAAAGDARAAAYGPAYERYLRFKRVVRDALGRKSTQYQRIHVRTARAGEDEPETVPEPEMRSMPAPPPSAGQPPPSAGRPPASRPIEASPPT